MLAQSLRGEAVVPPPETTALGGLLRHLQTRREDFQPSNVTWSMVPPLEGKRLKKHDRYEAMGRRALEELARWIEKAAPEDVNRTFREGPHPLDTGGPSLRSG